MLGQRVLSLPGSEQVAFDGAATYKLCHMGMGANRKGCMLHKDSIPCCTRISHVSAIVIHAIVWRIAVLR